MSEMKIRLNPVRQEIPELRRAQNELKACASQIQYLGVKLSQLSSFGSQRRRLGQLREKLLDQAAAVGRTAGTLELIVSEYAKCEEKNIREMDGVAWGVAGGFPWSVRIVEKVLEDVTIEVPEFIGTIETCPMLSQDVLDSLR